MSLIDWSDPDEMLGLLIEYVTDEATASRDPVRADLLRSIAADLDELSAREFASVDEIAGAIGEIRESQPREILDDPVMAHVDACIEELLRIGMAS